MCCVLTHQLVHGNTDHILGDDDGTAVGVSMVRISASEPVMVLTRRRSRSCLQRLSEDALEMAIGRKGVRTIVDGLVMAVGSRLLGSRLLGSLGSFLKGDAG